MESFPLLRTGHPREMWFSVMFGSNTQMTCLLYFAVSISRFEKVATRPLEIRDSLLFIFVHLSKTLLLFSKKALHVGIVGRTGAGKTTLISALFRLIEPSRGSILVDGIDITSLNICDVRRRLSVIPQDPVVFSGSWSDNLDPYAEHTGTELKAALAHVGIASEELDLTAPLVSMSLGEKQLLCIARALLRKSTILVQDESTSSIDTRTDNALQRMFVHVLQNVTTISIAHRLQTVIQSDLVFVMDSGCVVEMDHPRALVNRASQFRSLVLETGASSQYLIGMANAHFVKEKDDEPALDDDDLVPDCSVQWDLFSKDLN